GGRGSGELEQYLRDIGDAINEEIDDRKFDILKWWARNSVRYPILSEMVRDILAVPVSSVASESAFSCGGRVLSPFRSSLSLNIVKALICAEDWIRYESGKTADELNDKEEDQETIDYENVTNTFQSRVETASDIPSGAHSLPVRVDEEEEEEDSDDDEATESDEDMNQDDDDDPDDTLLMTLKKKGCANVGGATSSTGGGA
ncbi:unnamed protein product, partial [Linum tenue]